MWFTLFCCQRTAARFVPSEFQLYYWRAGKMGKITDFFNVSNQSVHDNIPSEDGIILVINVSMCLCHWKLLNAAKMWEKIFWNGVEKVWDWSSAVKWEQSQPVAENISCLFDVPACFLTLKKALTGTTFRSLQVPRRRGGWSSQTRTHTWTNKTDLSRSVSTHSWPSLRDPPCSASLCQRKEHFTKEQTGL